MCLSPAAHARRSHLNNLWSDQFIVLGKLIPKSASIVHLNGLRWSNIEIQPINKLNHLLWTWVAELIVALKFTSLKQMEPIKWPFVHCSASERYHQVLLLLDYFAPKKLTQLLRITGSWDWRRMWNNQRLSILKHKDNLWKGEMILFSTT